MNMLDISYHVKWAYNNTGCAGDALDFILDEAMGMGSEGGEQQEPGMVQQLARTMTSLNRFMKSLQN